MAFEPSYNLLDKDTHNTLVEALKSGGIGYTEADGTVHKISDTYASGGGSSLPEVSAADNGDVLTVVEGEWAKAAPSGGGGYDFTVEGTPSGTGGHNYALKSGDYATMRAKLLLGQPVFGVGYVKFEIDEGGVTGYGFSEIAIILSVNAVNEEDGIMFTYNGGDFMIRPDGSIIPRQ